ncbi:hypothetical protein NPIL_447071 [Nephila pilipes]|uniref:Uncharacterized protein n=1 Tax=Nephila pilipes TaxID=299642 RepID=A0A8X6ULR6_NEPPI|nr:hypothetical protein NPIL_447071 [Nephila pilipes]
MYPSDNQSSPYRPLVGAPAFMMGSDGATKQPMCYSRYKLELLRHNPLKNTSVSSTSSKIIPLSKILLIDSVAAPQNRPLDVEKRFEDILKLKT